MKAKSLADVIEYLELSLLNPSVRESSEQIITLLADDFLEFGSSGKIYHKSDCIVPDEKLRNFSVSNFAVKELAPNVILATYITKEDEILTLRSSIWKLDGAAWQMVFHQGTKVQKNTDEQI